MVRKPSLLPAETALPEWDPDLKELWHFNFEKELVNDEKWSCLVTAAIQAEAQDEECIQTYDQCIRTGLRKAVKIISMADVVRLLKEFTNANTIKKEDKNSKVEKQERRKPLTPRSSQIIELAAKYAIFSDVECKLPSDLTAAVIKHMVLNLKEENCFQKRVDAARQRKIRDQQMKAKFIREVKPYEMSQEERKSYRKVSTNILECDQPINDELIDGPDLYIMLTDFYDPLIFPELLRMNVPFLAILKISTIKTSEMGQTSSVFVPTSNIFGKKKSIISSFWEKMKEESFDVEKLNKFKNIAILQYKAPSKPVEQIQTYYKIIFDELTWMLYSAYRIYRQHQKYLQEFYVQRIIMSLEPLDLSKCEIYNKLCDALVTGEPLTPLLVLYAIIEQVVAGMPETNSVSLEYEPQYNNFFPIRSESNSIEIETSNLATHLVTPCKICRDKKYTQYICEKSKTSFNDHMSSQRDERAELSERSSSFSQIEFERNSSLTSQKLRNSDSSESIISEFLIDRVMSEKKTKRELRKEKKWKTPTLIFYGDSVFLQTYFCDPRLLNYESIIDRFLKTLYLPRIWTKYPSLSLGERVFFDFHFFSLWKMSKDSEEILKLKISFAMVMKLIGITMSYLFKGEEDSISEILSGMVKEKAKLPKVKFEKNSNIIQRKENKNFNKFFLRTFIQNDHFQTSTEKIVVDENEDQEKTNSNAKILHKVKAHFSMTETPQGNSTKYFLDCFAEMKSKADDTLHCVKKNSIQENFDKILAILYTVLDCLEISNLTEHYFLTDKEDYLVLIQDFKYYEKLKPNLMIQRLMEAQDSYNTVQCSYFSLTDSIIIIMYNDFDHRGIFYRNEHGVLPTPVTLRDFYIYVYPEISDWLANENAEYLKFVSETQEKIEAEQEKKDLKYWMQLRKQYCEMNEEKRKEFLETNVEVELEPVILENELGELPVKPKFYSSSQMPFITTNYTDVRVETNQKVYEFHSPDGTKLNLAVETWLYTASSLLKVKAKKSKLELYYNQWLNEEKINSSFTLKTSSDIIFAFDKKDSEQMDNLTYQVKISWPTGLLIQPVFYNSSLYIKQNYLKPYRRGWDIEEETSRCFLRNGQVIIFKENGNYDILSGSGTKYLFYESAAGPKYDIISTTGEIWEVRFRGPCRNRRKLIGTNKIFIGVDRETDEVFYKREDGVCFMLWPNGSLVINYSDGTKITSTPCFEEKEVTIEWTEEEKLLLEETEQKLKSEISFQERSRKILRNSSTPKSMERKSFVNEGFVSVSCTYLIEHPKYSSVYFNPKDLCIKVTMLEQLSIFIHPEGNYEIQQEKNFLEVRSSRVEFYTSCDECNDKSTVTLNINSDKVLCRFVDFFKKAFFVFRDGRTLFRDYYMESNEESDDDSIKLPKSRNIQNKCPAEHNKKFSLAQRCFLFERDLSGVEFIHEECFGYYCFQLPDETFFDINTDDPINSSCTFSSPYYRIGYEKWVMDYENNENSSPTNLKRKDLKELGTKDIQKNLFKYTFPYRGDRQQNKKLKRKINMPKIIVGRTVKCLSQEPDSIINELQKSVMAYQKRARHIIEEYKSHKASDDQSKDSRYVEMRLRKIALTLNQSLQMYPHLCTQLPSTEKDIHYFGHFINAMEELKSSTRNQMDILPDCKQIPMPLSRWADFPCISEESEISQDIFKKNSSNSNRTIL